MNYHVKLEDGSALASFEHEYDRDVFIEAIREKHPDVDNDYFNAVDD